MEYFGICRNFAFVKTDRLKESTLIIYAVTAVALLPALLLRDFTPDNELRYISIADEALRQGSWLCFYNHGVAYADKPPLYLWIVMAGRALAGSHCLWLIGLFSLVPMLLTGRVMEGWCREGGLSAGQRRSALWMLFTCGYFPALGVVMRMDMLMTLWIVLALRETYRMALGGPSRRHEALLGVYTFLALFTKGPLGVLIPLAGSVVWLVSTGRAGLIRRIWGWPAWTVLLGGCAVWWGGVYAEGGREYLDNLLFHQTVDRSVNAFTHARPWWYYVAGMWYIMAPWSVVTAWLVWKHRHLALAGDFRRMMAAVFLSALVILSCISSKLQVYLLPAIPFAVCLGASLIESEKLETAVRWVAFSLLTLIFMASWAIPFLNSRIGYGEVCREAAALGPTEVIVDPSVRRGENIDVYFDCPVRVADLSAPDLRPQQGAVGLLPGDKDSGQLLKIKTF